MKKQKSLKFKGSIGIDLGNRCAVLDVILWAKVNLKRYKHLMYRTQMVREQQQLLCC